MDYKVRNLRQTIDRPLIDKAKEVASKTSENGVLTDKQENSLLNVAAKDGIVSEEELKFIGGLSNKENIRKFKSDNFNPVNNEISFNKVPEGNLNRLRDKIQADPNKYQSKASEVEKLVKQRPELRPLFNALNDKSLNKEQKLELITKYQSEIGSKTSTLKAFLHGVINYDPNPLDGIVKSFIDHNPFGSSDDKTKNINKNFFDHREKTKKGVYNFFYNETLKEPTKNIINKLSESVGSGKIKTPQQLFEKATELSKGLKDEKGQALKSVACIMNSVHTGLLGSEETYEMGISLQKTYKELNLNDKDIEGVRSVMSHNVKNNEKDHKNPTQDFTSDNNMHFWTHASVTYEFMKKGFSEQDARGLSAYIGAEYEVKNIDENNGNSGIKDVLMNAYGAEFGINLFKNKDTQLPEKHEGPQVENKVDFQ